MRALIVLVVLALSLSACHVDDRHRAKFALNQADLDAYYQAIESGKFPEHGRIEAGRARAIEMVLKKGYNLDRVRTLDIESRGTVPVHIALDGVSVPITEKDYIPKERAILRFITAYTN